MDEQRAANLEKALNEKVYFLNELNRKKLDDDREIQILREEI